MTVDEWDAWSVSVSASLPELDAFDAVLARLRREVARQLRALARDVDEPELFWSEFNDLVRRRPTGTLGKRAADDEWESWHAWRAEMDQLSGKVARWRSQAGVHGVVLPLPRAESARTDDPLLAVARVRAGVAALLVELEGIERQLSERATVIAAPGDRP